MIQLTDAAQLTAWRDARRRDGARIGFVPTMGFLHEGHASLMRLLRPQVDALVVSIYVNPLQFAPGEDLSRYPRDPDGDAARCAAEGVDALFTPTQLYPEGFATTVRVDGLTARLCGADRPTHFQGVTTVCARLFGLTGADVAAFGEKDYQQLAVIRQLVRDLALPVQIVGGPLIRDADGLALSSRNSYLQADQRRRALTLHRALFALADEALGGVYPPGELIQRAIGRVDADAIDYLELVDARTLTPLDRLDRPARALVAARYGRTRLLDNVPVAPAPGVT